jgi:tight adherence protein C
VSLQRRLDLSGLPWSADWLAGLKAMAAAGGAAVGLVPAWMAPPAAALIGLLALLGYRAPDLVLARRGRHRQRAIELHVPDLVELLVATTEAGLAPSIALRRSASVVGGPLGGELALATTEMDLGVPWATAMDHLVHRTDVPALHRLVAALSRSNRLGTSVRSTLRSVAGDLRAERRVHAEETARRAPVKMLFPLVFLILPAFLLLTVGPVVLATIQSLRSGG